MVSIRKFNITFLPLLIVFEVIVRNLVSYFMQKVDKVGRYILEVVGTVDFACSLKIGAGLFKLDFV